MIPTIVIAGLLAQPFTAFSGTGQAGGGSAQRPRTGACYGDSVTQGAGAPTPYPVALDGLLPGGVPQGYFVSNEGIAGETAHEIYLRAVSGVEGIGAATACIGAPCGFYVVQGMVNTLKSGAFAEEEDEAVVAEVALNGASASASGTCDTGTAHACGLLDTVDYLHATYPRARIFAMGVTPYKGCDFITCGTLVQPGERAAAANAGLLAACASRAWLTCVITYDELEDPERPDFLDPDVDSGDGIHPDSDGALRIAQGVFEAAVW